MHSDEGKKEEELNENWQSHGRKTRHGRGL